MGTTPASLAKPSKVVVGCRDGRRLKGFVFNFSAARDQFHLFTETPTSTSRGVDIKFEVVKAVFFVKDFEGVSGRKDAYDLEKVGHGRKLEVTFHDGEKIAGTTEAYNPTKVGFFLFPADAESNNLRIFVVNRSVKNVKFA